MNPHIYALLALLSPTVFLITGIISWFLPGMRPKFLKTTAMSAAVINLFISGACCVLVFQLGLLESPLLGIHELGFSIRLDTISVLMLSMIALLSFIIIKFSMNYLDGEKRQGAFIGRLAVTIACVQLFVLSGNLGLLVLSWILTSTSLHRLLIFYPERPGAIAVARKKFLVARLADLCICIACALLYTKLQTGNLEIIFSYIKNHALANDSTIEWIAVFIALAAVIKSAQFPTHGWLIEVMETPTPVSALLHAGLLNAGPFLIIRMSYIMDASTYAPLLLISIGGITALFASVVYLTQTSIKTALGYSSVAHMGFSLFACGMGVYAAAMLHLVSHSFYKAHAFLASGSTIDLKRGLKITPLVRLSNPFKIGVGLLLALIVYSSFAFLLGIHVNEQFNLFAIGAIIFLGLARIFSNALDTPFRSALVLRATFLACTITLAFFLLESAMQHVLANQIPPVRIPTLTEILLIICVLSIYTTAVGIQMYAPLLSGSKSSFHSWAIHLRNGFYINALFDRLIGSLKINYRKNRFDWE